MCRRRELISLEAVFALAPVCAAWGKISINLCTFRMRCVAGQGRLLSTRARSIVVAARVVYMRICIHAALLSGNTNLNPRPGKGIAFGHTETRTYVPAQAVAGGPYSIDHVVHIHSVHVKIMQS